MALTPLPHETAPPMTEGEYDAALKALDQERRDLEVSYTASQTYPRWAYHATEPAHLVYSDAEALALGEGWSGVPLGPTVAVAPVLTALEPDTAALGSPSFTLTVTGTGFTPAAVILWNGSEEPTTYVSETALTTGVDMATAEVAIALPVAVWQDGVESNALTFTLTEA